MSPLYPQPQYSHLLYEFCFESRNLVQLGVVRRTSRHDDFDVTVLGPAFGRFHSMISSRSCRCLGSYAVRSVPEAKTLLFPHVDLVGVLLGNTKFRRKKDYGTLYYTTEHVIQHLVLYVSDPDFESRHQNALQDFGNPLLQQTPLGDTKLYAKVVESVYWLVWQRGVTDVNSERSTMTTIGSTKNLKGSATDLEEKSAPQPSSRKPASTRRAALVRI